MNQSNNYLPEPDDSEVYCSQCDSEMVWEDCYECGGDGCIEDDDNDMYLLEPEITQCTLCEGKGGWYICTNKHA